MFSKSLAILCLFQIVVFALTSFTEAGPIPKTNSTTLTKEEDGETEEDRQLSEQLEKRLSPEGLKISQAIDALVEKFSSAEKPSNKALLQQQINGQLKQLSNADVRTTIEVIANAALAKNPSPEMRVFYESVKRLSLEGKRVMLSASLLAGINNEEIAETTIRQLGEGDRQTLMKAVMDELAKSPESSPEQKAFMGAIGKMSPEGKRLMFSMVFLGALDKNDAAAKAKLDQLSVGDLQILRNEVMAVENAKARGGETSGFSRLVKQKSNTSN